MTTVKKYLVNKTVILLIFDMYSILVIFLLKAIPSINDDYILKIFACIFSLLIGKDLYASLEYFKQNNLRKNTWIILGFSSLTISFSLVGNDLFYNKEIGYFETCFQNILRYILVCIYCLALCSTIAYWIKSKYRQKVIIEKDIKKNVFLIFFTSGLIYLVAYNPANMFPDSYMQLRQIYGIDPFFDWHPVFHTLILGFFITIFKTPIVFVLFHIFLFSYVMTKWLEKLYLKGLSKNLIYIFSLTFYLNIAYGLLITNIWKDNLYNICLIWCSYLIYEMIDDYTQFEKNKFNYICFFLSVVGIFICRHNGIIPTISIIIFLFGLTIKQKKSKKIYMLCLMLIALFFLKKPFYKLLNVVPNQSVVTYTPLVHDIASVIVFNNGSTLSDGVMDEMESILSIEQWKQQYNATDSDSYTFYYDEFRDNLNKKNTKEIIITYLNALKDEPLRIVGARILSSQIMWSTFKRINSVDYLYERNNTIEIEEEFGFIRKENVLTQFFNCLYVFFENTKILNILFFRTGIWFCILLISIVTVIIYNKNIKILLVLIPIISNMMSLAISMTCQHLRYVWALYIISILFLLIVIIEKSHKV